MKNFLLFAILIGVFCLIATFLIAISIFTISNEDSHDEEIVGPAPSGIACSNFRECPNIRCFQAPCPRYECVDNECVLIE